MKFSVLQLLICVVVLAGLVGCGATTDDGVTTSAGLTPVAPKVLSKSTDQLTTKPQAGNSASSDSMSMPAAPSAPAGSSVNGNAATGNTATN